MFISMRQHLNRSFVPVVETTITQADLCADRLVGLRAWMQREHGVPPTAESPNPRRVCPVSSLSTSTPRSAHGSPALGRHPYLDTILNDSEQILIGHPLDF